MPSGGGELTPVPAIPASVLAAFGTNVQFAASNMAVEWRAVRGTATSKRGLWQREIKESEEDSFAKASAKCKEVLIKARRSRQCAFMDCVTGLIIPGCEGEREKRSPLILSPGSCTRQGYPETTCSCACVRSRADGGAVQGSPGFVCAPNAARAQSPPAESLFFLLSKRPALQGPLSPSGTASLTWVSSGRLPANGARQVSLVRREAKGPILTWRLTADEPGPALRPPRGVVGMPLTA